MHNPRDVPKQILARGKQWSLMKLLLHWFDLKDDRTAKIELWKVLIDLDQGVLT